MLSLTPRSFLQLHAPKVYITSTATTGPFRSLAFITKAAVAGKVYNGEATRPILRNSTAPFALKVHEPPLNIAGQILIN